MNKNRYLVSMLIFSVVMAIFLPLFDMVYLYPSLTRMLLNEAADQTRQVAGLLALEQDRHEAGQLEALRSAAGLKQISVLDVSGVVLLSTHTGSRGEVRNIDGYRKILMAGEVGTRLETQLENGLSRSRIVSYARLPQQGDLMTLIEVVKDISPLRQSLDKLTKRASLALLLVAGLFLGVVFYIALRARDALNREEKVARELDESRLEIIQKHEELQQLFNQVAKAKKEWQLTLDCLDEMVLLTDKKGMVRRCNRSLARFVGQEFVAILGRHWQKVLFVKGVEVLSMDQKRFEIYHSGYAQHYGLDFYSSEEDQEMLTVIRVTPVAGKGNGSGRK